MTDSDEYTILDFSEPTLLGGGFNDYESTPFADRAEEHKRYNRGVHHSNANVKFAKEAGAGLDMIPNLIVPAVGILGMYSAAAAAAVWGWNKIRGRD